MDKDNLNFEIITWIVHGSVDPKVRMIDGPRFYVLIRSTFNKADIVRKYRDYFIINNYTTEESYRDFTLDCIKEYLNGETTIID